MLKNKVRVSEPGDFDGNGYTDLAVGVPGEALGNGNVYGAGMVTVIYGSEEVGLTAGGNQNWYQSKEGVLGDNESDNRFGYSLTTVDVNGDGLEDLAIGVLVQDVDGVKDAA